MTIYTSQDYTISDYIKELKKMYTLTDYEFRQLRLAYGYSPSFVTETLRDILAHRITLNSAMVFVVRFNKSKE